MRASEFIALVAVFTILDLGACRHKKGGLRPRVSVFLGDPPQLFAVRVGVINVLVNELCEAFVRFLHPLDEVGELVTQSCSHVMCCRGAYPSVLLEYRTRCATRQGVLWRLSQT